MQPERRYAEWLSGSPYRKPPILLWLGFAALSGASLVRLSLGAHPAYASRLYLGLFVVAFLIAYAGAHVEKRRGDARLPLGEIPSEIEQFPAVVTLSRETEYGDQEGLVAFVDGWLVFSGREFGFSVRRTDIEALDSLKLEFRFQGPLASHRAAIRPLGRGLAEAWVRWYWDRAEVSGKPAYPPVAPAADFRPCGFVWIHGVSLASASLLTLRNDPIVAVLGGALLTWTIFKTLAERDALRRMRRSLAPRRALFPRAFRPLKALGGPEVPARPIVE